MTKGQRKSSRDHTCFCNIPLGKIPTECIGRSRTCSKKEAAHIKKHVSISNSRKETINEPELSGKTGTNNNFINHISGTSSLLMIVFQEGAHKTLLLFLYMGLLLSYHHVCLNGIGHLFCARFIDVALELRASGNSFF